MSCQRECKTVIIDDVTGKDYFSFRSHDSFVSYCNNISSSFDVNSVPAPHACGLVPPCI